MAPSTGTAVVKKTNTYHQLVSLLIKNHTDTQRKAFCKYQTKLNNTQFKRKSVRTLILLHEFSNALLRPSSFPHTSTLSMFEVSYKIMLPEYKSTVVVIINTPDKTHTPSHWVYKPFAACPKLG